MAAQRTARAAAPKIADDFPIPPIPPLTRPLPSVAPVPDADLTAPSSLASGPTVALKFYRAPTFDPGYGFAPGSRYRSPEDRKPIQTPGFSVSVPIR
ncbi:MAG TPA: hypothetical protein VHB27_13120 [Rhodopila sp.]|uniref:hypothetical protein n=1 Tax=Rhodopila sp. TaxID=2480087 RepID=UPI002CA04867|nr:hypothetical protein [Rhodopila sp.]HVY16159.1 hypothetical protein [Rhodopila sp.]